MDAAHSDYLRHCNAFVSHGGEVWLPAVMLPSGEFTTPEGLKIKGPKAFRKATHAEIVAEMDDRGEVPLTSFGESPPSSVLDAVAKAIFEAVAPLLPRGNYMVWAEPDNDCIMIGTEETAFTIRRKAIDAGLHIQTAKALVPHLVEAVVAAGAVRMETAYPKAADVA